MKKLLLALVCIAMVGCSTTKQPVIQQKQDPNWPDQIQQFPDINFKVDNINGKLWVGMTFQDSNELASWLNDEKRYIQDQKSMICYYRSHLNEPRCKGLIVNNESKK